MLHDMIGTDGYGDRIDLRSALRKIHDSKCGVLLLIGGGHIEESLINDINSDEPSLEPETKTVGIGAQILREIGLKKIKLLAKPVKYPSLSGFDLEVVGFEK